MPMFVLNILAVIGFVCILTVILASKLLLVTWEEGWCAVLASFFTVLIMLAGYVIVVRMLEYSIGISW